MHNPFEWFTKDGGRSIFDKLTQNFKESFQFLIFVPTTCKILFFTQKIEIRQRKTRL